MIPAKYWSPTKKLMVLGAMAGGKLVEDTATGNPLTFTTDIAKPLKSLLIPFTPQQEGTGDPSPSNIRSILPWNGLTVFGGGVNLCSGGWVDGGISGSTGAEDSDTARMRSEYFPIKGGVNYYVVSNDKYKRIFFYDKEKTFISSDSGSREVKTAPDNAYYARAVILKETTQPSEFSFNYPSTETALAPYHPITDTDIVFPSPVYGGTLDVVSGVLTVEYGIYTLTGNEEYGLTGSGQHVMTVPTMTSLNCKSFADKDLSTGLASFAKTKKYNDLNVSGETDGIGIGSRYIILGSVQYEALSELVGQKICYELAEPQTVTLTPAQITALVGNNTIWSDADGQLTAVYLKKG